MNRHDQGTTPALAPDPIIVSALFGAADFAWLDGLRRAHFPPERNLLSAHLTLFHNLPARAAPAILRHLDQATRAPPPLATAAALIKLGRGVAIRIESPQLTAIRATLAAALAELLVRQDAAGWRPHVTIQNKVRPAEADALHDALVPVFCARPVAITGLAAWRYRRGPWEPLSQHAFA